MPIYTSFVTSPVTSTNHRARLSALLFAFILVLSACGAGGDDSSESAQSDAPSGDAESDQTTEAPADSTDSDSTDADSTDAGDDGAEAPSSDVKRSRLGDQVLAANLATTTGRFEGRIMISGGVDVPVEGVELVFLGAFDSANQASEISIDLGAVALAAAASEGTDLGPMAAMFEEPMVVRTVGDRSYISWSLFSLLTGGDTTWIESDASDADGITSSFGATGNGSPIDFLAALEEANADITELGTEEVRGVSTTHLRAVVDLAELDASLTDADRATLERDLGDITVSEFPIEFWLDDQGLIRRYSMDFSEIAASESDVERAGLVFEFFDYGTDISIAAPPADEVMSADELDLGAFGFGN